MSPRRRNRNLIVHNMADDAKDDVTPLAELGNEINNFLDETKDAVDSIVKKYQDENKKLKEEIKKWKRNSKKLRKDNEELKKDNEELKEYYDRFDILDFEDKK